MRHAPDEWLRGESLAAALMAEFSLSGDYATLAEAGDVLREARADAIAGSGPWLREAAFAMTVHDLDAARLAIDNALQSAVPLPAGDRAEIIAMRGDMALYRGDMDRAAGHYAEATRLQAGSTAFRQAMLARMQGRFDDAIALFGQAAREGSGTPLAQAHIALQLGATESARGRYDAARLWYDVAERLLPGHPLIALYRAEAQALAGDISGAAKAMEGVADRYRWPEAMDALAMLYRAQGNRERSSAWSDRASEIWERRMHLVPSAARFHMAEHALAFGEATQALALAQQELRSRPYAEARILLANALMANGRPEEAVTHLRRAEDSGWRSAPMYAALAQANAMLGKIDAAEQARNKAEALNPRIFDGERMLVWFAHG
ncbi:tetratricopeptide repeat protein [Croceicoccus naphthovorans]|uniref:tetratricopeptide repeat protein n=1 Tax=Croceicoccus naphthovorans TaxID=1348774 RepID=UPI00069CFD72|nr:tetratricopeptide repeat protein [Croceicoccus naphthovorans]MBB3992216.1 tetratricopeptide (TPR) repeat protein [Croceicoccus naphthovorans]